LSLNQEGRVPIIAMLDVGKYIYKSTVKLKEMALPQQLKVSTVFCDQ
jgi:translation initiation factor IF-3